MYPPAEENISKYSACIVTEPKIKENAGYIMP
jgi:hypothetical protein